VFAVIFIAGGISHLVLGRVNPQGYSGFGATAWIPWLRTLWSSFVMPNIGWLTILLGIYEIACGVLMIPRRTVRLAALGMALFLVFITILGYGFPTTSFGEDLLKNRLITLVMFVLTLPVLTRKQPRSAD
jgi:uncharacterized membrane protein YphA (DoxX/SURF4 family)